MSIDVISIVFNKENQSKSIVLSGRRVVKLALANLDDDKLGDLELTVSGNSHSLEGFCGRASKDGTTGYFPAELTYFANQNQSMLVLIGLFEVCVVRDAGDISVPLRMFRSTNADRAFFKTITAWEYNQFYIIYYEGGVFCLSTKGVVEWHTQLSSDDALLNRTKLTLTFSNEHIRDGEPWKLRLIDGSIEYP